MIPVLDFLFVFAGVRLSLPSLSQKLAKLSSPIKKGALAIVATDISRFACLQKCHEFINHSHVSAPRSPCGLIVTIGLSGTTIFVARVVIFTVVAIIQS